MWQEKSISTISWLLNVIRDVTNLQQNWQCTPRKWSCDGSHGYSDLSNLVFLSQFVLAESQHLRERSEGLTAHLIVIFNQISEETFFTGDLEWLKWLIWWGKCSSSDLISYLSAFIPTIEWASVTGCSQPLLALKRTDGESLKKWKQFTLPQCCP